MSGEEHKEDNNRIKKWLEGNKIYFETVMTVFLTIMSIVVSVMSVITSTSIEKKAIELQEKQLRLSYLPMFSVTRIFHNDDYENNRNMKIPYVEYNIINNNGYINDSYLRVESKVEIILWDSDNNKNICITIDDQGKFFKSYSYFDSSLNGFIIKENFDDNRYMLLRSYLSEHLHEDYKEFDNVYILVCDYINIQYNDIFKEFHDDWYELSVEELLDRSPWIPDVIISLDISDLTDNEVYEAVTKALEQVIDTQ